MNKKITAVSVLIVAILFISSIAGTIVYYNGIVNDSNSKIASLNTQIANLNSQISNLQSQITNLTTANLVADLMTVELPYDAMKPPLPYSDLYITGSVNNTGHVTAYNAGLHVAAYDGNGGLAINMTFPLVYDKSFGTDSATDNYVSGLLLRGSLQLGSLGSGQRAPISLDIYHEGTVSKWTITPVWTN
jgi:hypothetical protein